MRERAVAGGPGGRVAGGPGAPLLPVCWRWLCGPGCCCSGCWSAAPPPSQSPGSWRTSLRSTGTDAGSGRSPSGPARRNTASCDHPAREAPRPTPWDGVLLGPDDHTRRRWRGVPRPRHLHPNRSDQLAVALHG